MKKEEQQAYSRYLKTLNFEEKIRNIEMLDDAIKKRERKYIAISVVAISVVFYLLWYIA